MSVAKECGLSLQKLNEMRRGAVNDLLIARQMHNDALKQEEKAAEAAKLHGLRVADYTAAILQLGGALEPIEGYDVEAAHEHL